MWMIAVLIAAGLFIADRVNKLPLVLTFLGVYFLLFSATAFAGDARQVAGAFRAPDLHAVLYFAFFMLTDPPTAPIKYRDQIVCGVLVGAVSYAIFEISSVVYYLLAGLMVGNAWEAWRRVRFKRMHARLAVTES
jgi:Na+-translocating ferredoxin:NAD+ oxidoreductase RnfD subunit